MTLSINRRTFVAGAAALGTGSLAGLLPVRASAAETIRIGWVSSLTGPLSSAAINENIGVQYAVEEINKAGGINGRMLELLTRDSGGDPTKAVTLAHQLAQADKVHAVIGPVNSGESLATVPALARSGVPNIVIGTVDTLTDYEKYPRAFRAINTNTQWLAAGNNYVLNTLKKRKIAVIGDTTGYGTSTLKQASDLLGAKGVTPVWSALIDPNKTDLTSDISKAREAGADVIMPWSAATGFLARILNARGDSQWNVPIVGHPSLMTGSIRELLNKPEYWDNTFASGYVSTSYGPDGQLPARTKALMEAIRPRLGGKEITFTFWFVALGYDTVKIVEHAIRTAGSTDPAAMQKALESGQTIPGVYTDYTYGPKTRNGFPESGIAINVANSFRDGCFKVAQS